MYVLFVISESMPPYKHPMRYHKWACYLFQQKFRQKLSLHRVSLKAPVLNVQGKNTKIRHLACALEMYYFPWHRTTIERLSISFKRMFRFIVVLGITIFEMELQCIISQVESKQIHRFWNYQVVYGICRLHAIIPMNAIQPLKQQFSFV